MSPGTPIWSREPLKVSDSVADPVVAARIRSRAAIAAGLVT
jgi:hypothetical protein